MERPNECPEPTIGMCNSLSVKICAYLWLTPLLILRNQQSKYAALAVLAFQFDAAFDQHRQLLAEVQAQARAFAPIISVDLLKCLEQSFSVGGANTYPSVDDVDRSERVPVRLSSAQLDLDRSLVGEFDCVVGQIDQNLTENAPIRINSHTALR